MPQLLVPVKVYPQMGSPLCMGVKGDIEDCLLAKGCVGGSCRPAGTSGPARSSIVPAQPAAQPQRGCSAPLLQAARLGLLSMVSAAGLQHEQCSSALAAAAGPPKAAAAFADRGCQSCCRGS